MLCRQRVAARIPVVRHPPTRVMKGAENNDRDSSEDAENFYPSGHRRSGYRVGRSAGIGV